MADTGCNQPRNIGEGETSLNMFHSFVTLKLILTQNIPCLSKILIAEFPSRTFRSKFLKIIRLLSFFASTRKISSYFLLYQAYECYF